MQKISTHFFNLFVFREEPNISRQYAEEMCFTIAKPPHKLQYWSNAISLKNKKFFLNKNTLNRKGLDVRKKELTAYILGPVILYLVKLTRTEAADLRTSTLEMDLFVTDM